MINGPESDVPKRCQPGEHDWADDYYGQVCRICGDFMPEPLSEEQERELEHEEYRFMHGTCDICGGEWGDGWSQCTCEYDPDDPTLNMTIHELHSSTERFDHAAQLAEEGM